MVRLLATKLLHQSEIDSCNICLAAFFPERAAPCGPPIEIISMDGLTRKIDFLINRLLKCYDWVGKIMNFAGVCRPNVWFCRPVMNNALLAELSRIPIKDYIQVIQHTRNHISTGLTNTLLCGCAIICKHAECAE
jgi:hypothetical protein